MSRVFGMKRNGPLGLVTLVVLLGCGDAATMDGAPAVGGDAPMPKGGGPDGSMAEPKAMDDVVPGPGTPDGGDGLPLTSGDGGAMDAAVDEPDPVPLPDGSRVVDHVLNLVGSEGVEELEAYLTASEAAVHSVNRQGLLESTNTFLSLYREDYDFIVFATDHVVENTFVAGKFQALNKSAQVGTGNSTEVHPPNYRSDGRLKGIIGVQFYARGTPPIAHEIAHFWAQDLDEDFGFGVGAEQHFGPHWGYSSVKGQLGGFDPETLTCVQPAGAALTDCEPESSGRTRYRVAAFAPQAGGGRPYAPLELYLMGLAPLSMVPDPILILQDALTVPDSADDATGTVVVEAAGISELALADIVARHGEVVPLPEAERTFKIAFVLLSDAPATDVAMETVASWAAVLDGREPIPGLTSFEVRTSGLAKADTRLGPRRTIDEDVPEPRPALRCDVLQQDCPNPDHACHFFDPSMCMLAGTIAEGQPCSGNDQCLPGLGCAGAKSDPSLRSCQPYCDAADTSAAKACVTLCPSTYLYWVDDDDQPIGAVCREP